jgi:CRP-like cAMP-binding protein
MSNLTHFLTTIGLQDQSAHQVAGYFEEERLLKGENIVIQGRSCTKLSVINEGYLRFYKTIEAKEITHWIFGKDHLITDVGSFFLNQPTKWNIQAISTTNLYSITTEGYSKLKADVPEWTSYENLFLVKLMSALENRIYTLISMSTEERYNYLFKSDREIFNQIPLQYIASMLGMSAETLSRIRSKSIS